MALKDKDSNGEEISSSGNSKTTRRRAQILSLCPSLPREFDIFGFYLSPKHSLIALIISYLMVGLIGTFLVLSALAVYTILDRRSQSSTSSGRTSGGRGVQWGGGANIRGVKDLPCDPKRGLKDILWLTVLVLLSLLKKKSAEIESRTSFEMHFK